MNEMGKVTQKIPISKAVCSLMDRWMKSERLNEVAVSGSSMKPLLNEGMNVVVEHRRGSIKSRIILVARLPFRRSYSFQQLKE